MRAFVCFLLLEFKNRTGATLSVQEEVSPKKDAAFIALAEACFRFTPKIAVLPFDRGGAILLDIRGCQELFSEQGLSSRLLTLGRRFLFIGRVSFAEDISTALALACYPDFRKKEDLPLEALSIYGPLFQEGEKVKEFHKNCGEMILAFQKLGLKTISDFLRLPSQSLASRFGRNAVEIRARIEGRLQSGWPGFQPVQKVSEKSELEESIDLDAVFFVLRGLVDRAMARLRGMSKRASVVKVELSLKKFSFVLSTEGANPKRIWEIALPLAQGSTPGLMTILREKISFDLSQNPLPGPVEAITFEILEDVPGRGSQLDFFNKKEKEEELLSSLIARLVLQLGRENVFTAVAVSRYRPEKAWARELKFDEDCASHSFIANPPRVKRPLRLLKKPEALYYKENILIQPGGGKWEVLAWEGPERLAGEWWRDPETQGFNRDYYQVMTANGEQLWVFINRKADPPVFYLHGFFD